MLRRRLLYLLCLIGCFGFYIAYREWMAWLFFMTVLLLPWFSLLVSLPAMLTVRLSVFADATVTVGEELPLHLKMRSPLPAPPLAWKFRITSAYDPETTVASSDDVFCAKHCGCYSVRVKGGWIYDYLGLFRIPFGKKLHQKIYVLPSKITVENYPSLKKYLSATWKPMPETFSEHYDLRLYRPGDSLKQIHWKLSSKTGKFILREPIVPQRGILALSVILSGSADALDRKLGRILYMSELFLEKELKHEIYCLSGDGVKVFKITNEQELARMFLLLLNLPLTDADDLPEVRAAWHYQVGGEQDEV